MGKRGRKSRQSLFRFRGLCRNQARRLPCRYRIARGKRSVRRFERKRLRHFQPERRRKISERANYRTRKKRPRRLDIFRRGRKGQVLMRDELFVLQVGRNRFIPRKEIPHQRVGHGKAATPKIRFRREIALSGGAK